MILGNLKLLNKEMCELSVVECYMRGGDKVCICGLDMCNPRVGEAENKNSNLGQGGYVIPTAVLA